MWIHLANISWLYLKLLQQSLPDLLFFGFAKHTFPCLLKRT